jgi:hypothetical protein
MGAWVADSITVSGSASVGLSGARHGVSDSISVSDEAVIAFGGSATLTATAELRAMDAAVRARAGRLGVAGPSEKSIDPQISRKHAKRTLPFTIERNNWEIAVISIGLTVGGIAGSIAGDGNPTAAAEGAAIGAIVLYGWGSWRWNSERD